MATTNGIPVEQKESHISPTVTNLDPSNGDSGSLSPIPSSHTAIPSSSAQTYRVIESARLGLTILVLLLGIAILSTSADVVSAYNKTHLGSEFVLPLWGGNKQDARGEIAVLVGGVIVVFMTLLDVLAEKIYTLRCLPNIHTLLSFLAPIAGLITSIVAIGLQYHINGSSSTSTLQSWSCQWQAVSISSPNFNMICKETKASLYLTVILIPLEITALGLAGARVAVGKKVGGMAAFDRKG